MSEVIYHYTGGHKLKDIFESGRLEVSEWERKNGVRPPALWLSLNSVWEPTATKLVNENGNIRRSTKEEQFEKVGLYRFVIPFEKERFCSRGKYKYKTNTNLETYNNLHRQGITEGADPADWYASFKDIPLESCISCEKWNGESWELFKPFQS